MGTSKPYGRVLADLPWHDKCVAVSEDIRAAAFGFYTASICFCQAGLTDGVIRNLDLPRVMPIPEYQRLADALVEVGLFDKEDGQYRVHDYLEHNKSRSEVEAIKEAKREAGRLGGLSKASSKVLSKVPSNLPSKSPSKIEAKVYPDTDTDTECFSKFVSSSSEISMSKPSPRGRASDEPKSLNNAPPCQLIKRWSQTPLDKERVERSLAGHLLKTLESERGAAWVMKPANVGRVWASILAGCPDDCDGNESQACRCNDLFRNTVIRKTEYAMKQGSDPTGLIFHAWKEDSRV